MHIDMHIDAFGGFLCWVPDAAARLKRRSAVEDDAWNVSLAGIRPRRLKLDVNSATLRGGV